MRRHRATIVWLFLLPSWFLFACGPAQAFDPTISPAITNNPVPESTSTITISPIAMNCDDWAAIDRGEYQAQNNTWGKGDLSGWSQCIGLEMGADGTLIGRWTWDWLNAGTNVKAYPEIIFGQKPGATTTSDILPIKISDIGAATITYDVSSTYTGNGNVAFDLWLTDTPNPTTWDVPPITQEIMIWLDRQGAMSPGGTYIGRASLDDSTFAVYVADIWGQGWKYIAFVSAESRLGARTLDLGSYLSYIQENKLVKGDEYLASIEFGNEVATGAGETIVRRYTISIQKK